MLKRTKPEQVEPVGRRKVLFPKPLRNVLISAVILLVLLVGAGVAYTLYMDSNGQKDLTPEPVASTSVAPPITPRKPAPDAKEGAAVEMLMSPISVGTEESLSVRTNPTSSCKVAVIYGYDYDKKQTPISDPALGPQVADEYGTVSWTWTISPSAPLGPGKITVTCVYNGRSAVVLADLVVTK